MVDVPTTIKVQTQIRTKPIENSSAKDFNIQTH